MWNSIKYFFKYPKKTVWFTWSERFRYLYYTKWKGIKSYSINIKTGRNNYEVDGVLALASELEKCEHPFEVTPTPKTRRMTSEDYKQGVLDYLKKSKKQ